MTFAKKNKFAIPIRSGRQIRQDFLDFYRGKGHLIMPSSTIAPQDDPTLLFTNAGMNQFKAIFLGDNRNNLKRVANSQKCLRVSGKHNDLEEVGTDGTHHTFFEMLGNWSFGDYYKKEAIMWAWELLTSVWGLPKNRLFVTYHHEDLEARDLWLAHTDVPRDHVMPFVEENFWEMGATGPCGPCSEIHFDSGDLATQKDTYADKVLGVNGKNSRYFEIWNLVFIQFERQADQSLRPLAATHVDTGMGLERISTIIQGVSSNYETDLFAPIIAKIAELSGVPYSPEAAGTPHRVIADHLRALTFAICDGVILGNEGRGYVMRRILRRASRFAHKLGQKEAFIYRLVDTLVDEMQGAYPDLSERRSYIAEVIKAEEQRFLKTLDKGLQRINELFAKLAKAGSKILPGEEVFLLHDTFGFPSDLTALLAREQGFEVDHAGYERCMEQQQTRAREAANFTAEFADESDWTIISQGKETEFTGYTTLKDQAHIKRYAVKDDYVYIVLDKSPFYAEAGGQIGDVGIISSPAASFEVVGTFKRWDMHIHRCVLSHGSIEKAAQVPVHAEVDQQKRTLTRRNHTATHLLHAALKQVLGSHVNQQGSYVGPDRLRFDFTHHQALSEQERQEIEAFVNNAIKNKLAVATTIMPFSAAKASGAVALFGEKYGNDVRVLGIGEVSKELCGGTHVSNTGEIERFKILKVSSVAAGVRRIEAVTGDANVAAALDQERREEEEARKKLEAKEAQRKSAGERAQVVQQRVETLLREEHVAVGEHYYLATALDPEVFGKDDLQLVLDHLASRLGKGAAVCVHVEGEQLSTLVAVGKDAQGIVNANTVLQVLNPIAEGRGGGKADRARGGSRRTDRAEAVLATARTELAKLLSNK